MRYTAVVNPKVKVVNEFSFSGQRSAVTASTNNAGRGAIDAVATIVVHFDKKNTTATTTDVAKTVISIDALFSSVQLLFGEN